MENWIKCENRLPEHDNIVIVIASGKPCKNIELINAVELASCYNGEWVLDSYPSFEGAKVSHWMELPELPRELICEGSDINV